MAWLEDRVSKQFLDWECSGRGVEIFGAPVEPEPPFRPFFTYYLPSADAPDDGHKPTFVSSFLQKLSRILSTEVPEPASPPLAPEEIEPTLYVRETLVEIGTALPASLNPSREIFEQFLRSVSLCREPIAFELLGSHEKITAQLVTSTSDRRIVEGQLQAYFPETVFETKEDRLESAWLEEESDGEVIVEFGLGREFMFELSTPKLDPFVGIVGALSELSLGEVGLFQVLFKPVYNPWAESILRAVRHPEGRPFFVNAPELTKASERKVLKPLYAAVIRIGAKGEIFETALGIARNLSASLSVFAEPNGNELIPLRNSKYPLDAHVDDMLRRQSRRPGMLLNLDELLGFVHLPSSSVQSKRFVRDTGRTKALPKILQGKPGLLLGYNVHAGVTSPVRLTPEDRVRHTHIIGSSGTGKSTLLFNLIRQDIENGEGLAVFDPHGDLIDRILGIIPSNRIDDVILVDPSDDEYSIGFNILSAHSEVEKNLLASDLVSVFERLSTSWGDQMGSVLRNAILAFLESTEPGTLSDLRRFLVEPGFQTNFLKSVKDPDIVYYWQKAHPKLPGSKSIGSILTRLDTFLSPKPIRYMVSQPENRLDFEDITDRGKIFLAKLPEGLLGKENSYLLGTLLVSKFQQLAMSRQAKQIDSRRDFWIYADEFHNYMTPSMAEILSGARKYRVGLTLAHHELHQLKSDSKVASAVMSHPFTRIVFRVGDEDAKKLAEGFSHFEARDLKNLEIGQAIARVERSDYDFNLSITLPEAPSHDAAARRMDVVRSSRERFGTLRTVIEARIAERQTKEEPKEEIVKPPRKHAKAPPPVVPKEEEPSQPPVEQKKQASPSINTSPQEVPVPYATRLETPLPYRERAVPQEREDPISPQEPILEKSVPSSLGKGGVQHKAIQKRIKTAAQELGFKSSIEAELGSKGQSIDLLLTRDELTFACEIAIGTNTVDHEVGNVSKCIEAGYSRIVVLCIQSEFLENLKSAISGSLGKDATSGVLYTNPDDFILYLKTLAPLAPPKKEKPSSRRGYKIKRRVAKISPEEQEKREDITARAIAEALKKK